MDAIRADVWVLTETWRDLKPGPGYALIAQSADAPDRESATGECWVAIWSRLPAEALPLSADPERTAAARVSSQAGASLVIVGTVLPWLADRRYAPLRGSAAFCEVLGRQAAEWRDLQRDQPDSGLCVLGDFNQDLAPSHYYGSARGRTALECALVGAQLVCLTAGAGDPLSDVSGHASIDHVCISDRLLRDGLPSVVAWPSPPLERRRLTDHFGAYVDLPIS
jgi:hypothetical protein